MVQRVKQSNVAGIPQTDIKIRAERKWGELYRPKEAKAKAAAGPGRGKKGAIRSKAPFNAVPSLKDMGVSKTQSSKWQKLADLPEYQRAQASGNSLSHRQYVVVL